MEQYLLSIVIPVYNVGAHKLSRCIASLSKLQSRLGDKLRVIVVNDKSINWTEESHIIPSNFIKLSHDKNKGLSAARNTGLEYIIKYPIKSDWVWFIDSDDSIPEFDLDKFVNLLTTSDYDLMQFGANYVSDSGVSKLSYFNMYASTSYTNVVDTIKRNYKFVPAVWSKIYKVEFLRDNNLRNPYGFYFEDHEFLIRCLLAAKKVYSSDLVIYNYYYGNPDSIMNQEWGVKKVSDLYKVVRICRKLLSKFDKTEIKDRLTEYKNNELVWESKFDKLKLIDKIKVFIECNYWALTKGYIKYIIPDKYKILKLWK